MHAINNVQLEGSPPPWGVTAINGFVESVVSRAERGGNELPEEFSISFCPWGERNEAYHNLSALADVFEPRFRLVHFTSCGRPYLVAILTGSDAPARQTKAMAHLPWSEHYQGRFGKDSLTLTLVAEVEDIGVEPPQTLGERSLRRLFDSGELADF